MIELTEIDGIGPARSESLNEIGINSVENLAEADPDELTAGVDHLSDDKALELILSAEQAIVKDDDDADGDSDAIDELVEESSDEQEDVAESGEADRSNEDEQIAEEEASPDPSDDEDQTDDEVEDEASTYVVDCIDSKLRRNLLIGAVLDGHINHRSRNKSLSTSLENMLPKIEQDEPLEVTGEELNALYSCLREKEVAYKGENYITFMREINEMKDAVDSIRQNEMF